MEVVSSDLDTELLSRAKKLRSLKNLQSLEFSCMKVVLKNFPSLSSTLSTLPAPLKTSLLELLLQLKKQEKHIPLSLGQRVELIKSLLNSTVKQYDFSVLENAAEPFVKQKSKKLLALNREKIFNELWTQLAVKCPNLLKIRDMRPEMMEEMPNRLIKLNEMVFTFSDLLVLETNCTIDSGSTKVMCKKLRRLKKLEASYVYGMLPNAVHLHLLRSLKDLKLILKKSEFFMSSDFGMNSFNLNYFRVWPELGTYNSRDFEQVPDQWRNYFELDKLIAICDLEEIFVNLSYDFDILKLASFMPNLRRLLTRQFPRNLDTQLLLQFENLTSLHMFYDPQTLQALSFVGHKLKELCLSRDWSKTCTDANPFYDVLRVFTHCPNLEYLVLLRFSGAVNLDVPVAAESLKLKRLVLKGSFYGAPGFVPLVCRAPLLEEVKLEAYCSKQDVDSLITLLMLEEMFQNVTSVELVYRGDLALLDMIRLAKNVVASCPKLQTTHFEIETGEGGEMASSSIAPFVDLVERI